MWKVKRNLVFLYFVGLVCNKVKLSKNEPVAMKMIEDICNFLNCQPGDIMEMEKKVDKTTLLYRLREEKQIKLKGGIYHQTQVKLAYNSNHMESTGCK